jgi:hypothetical protein
MELSPSWEATSRLESQEFLIIRNLTVLSRVHKSSPLAPILNQLNLVHTNLSCFCQTNFNIILPFTPRSS